MAQHYGRNTYVSWDGDAILDLINFSGINATTDTIEHTAYGKTVKEFFPGYRDYGSLVLTLGTSNSMDLYRIRQSYKNHVVSTVNVVTPAGIQYGFRAFVTALGHTMDKMGMYTITLTLKITGEPTTMIYDEYVILPRTNTTLYRGCAYGLYLTPGGDTLDPTGGEGAIWLMSGAKTSGTGISGNTLTISSEETAGSIKVTAWIRSADDPTTQKSYGPVSYTISAPPVMVVTIVELAGSELEITKGAAKDWANYSVNTYPIGSSKTEVIWSLVDATNAPVDGTYATVDNGMIKFTTQFGNKYPPGPKKYVFSVIAKAGDSAIDTKTFAVTVKNA